MPVAIPDDDFTSGSGSGCCCSGGGDFHCPGCPEIIAESYQLCVHRIVGVFTSGCSSTFDLTMDFCVNGFPGTYLGAPALEFPANAFSGSAAGPTTFPIDAFRSITVQFAGGQACDPAPTNFFSVGVQFHFNDTTPGAACPRIPSVGEYIASVVQGHPKCDFDVLLGTYTVDSGDLGGGDHWTAYIVFLKT